MTGRLCLWLTLLIVSSNSPVVALIFEPGDTFLFVTTDDSPLILTPTDDVRIRLVEEAGANIALRVAPVDSGGVEIGSGRIVVLRASQERELRLRDEFAAEVLAGARLQIEVLAGRGRVSVAATDSTGRSLRPQPNATMSRRRAVRQPTVKPTTFQLIDQAESTGALDSETALLYRVYSIFGDARLPARYRGDDPAVVDSLYMSEVVIRYETLSPTTQAAVLPFLIPPAYEESWANMKGGSDPAVSVVRPPCRQIEAWHHVDAVRAPVRVWYRIDFPDLLTANAVASEVDTIWDKFVGLMKRSPLTDEKENCNGGDTRFDIYLTDLVPTTYEGILVPSSCQPTSAFIELGRFAFSVPFDSGKSNLAHELFHAFQFAFPVKSCSAWSATYGWWAEASATWAEDFADRHADREHDFAPDYLKTPATSLDLHDSSHEYGAYLLPFFVERSTGSADFVRVAWENCASDAALEAVDRAIPRGFEQVWPEFVKYNWNQKPVDDYTKWDNLTSGARATAAKLRLGPGTAINDIDYELPRLSASYHHILFSEDDSSVAFWNGVTTKLALRDVTGGVLGLQYVNDEADAAQTKGAHVTALIKMGESWTEEDWTKRAAVTYCRDELAERIDELVLIISNSEFKDRDRKLKPPGVKPVVYSSNMGCWQWKGTATWNGTFTTVTADATWTRIAASPLGFTFGAQGTLNWSANDCSAGGSVPISGFSSLLTFNFLPSESDYHRAYDTTGRGPTISACDRSRTLEWLNYLDERILKVRASGKIIDDTSATGQGADTWKWHFEAKRQ